jgi:xanthine dehydrogenase accessory factor
VLDYLLAEGVAQERVESVWAPAGLDLGAASPEEIALSIMSQIVTLRRGGGVAPLKQKISSAGDTTAATDKVIRQCEAGNNL